MNSNMKWPLFGSDIQNGEFSRSSFLSVVSRFLMLLNSLSPSSTNHTNYPELLRYISLKKYLREFDLSI